MPSNLLKHNDYSVGWICALPKERAAAQAMLDKEHECLSQPQHDGNAYTLGSIGNHNVVIACLPGGEIGNNAAANVATQMINTFPSIKFGLMVGIGGGIPSRVKLGDIVVSRPSGTFPGVVQWDLGKSEKLGFKRTGALDRPPRVLLTALAKLEAFHELHDSLIPKYLQDMVNKYPKLAGKYTWSPRLQDPILEPDIPEPSMWASIFGGILPALVTLPSALLGRKEPVEKFMPSMSDTTSNYGEPRGIGIHYGLIASGNQVVKDRIVRDQINHRLGGEVLCIEMEAAGLMNNFPCIVIRGICDYADEHKNKGWQEYAAAIAAGFSKELLQHVRPADVNNERPVKDILQKVQEGVLHIEQHVNKEEERKILDWLTTENHGQQHDMHSATHKKGTGQWILETDEFQHWLSNSKQRLLCKGMPGAGKTILTSVVIDHLVDSSKKDSGIGVAYIYCSFKQREQTMHQLLSSVLRQLASDRQPFPVTIRRLHEQHQAKQTHASQEQLVTELKTVIDLYSKVYVIIDALDECSLKPMYGFVSELVMLQQHYNMNIFATSRSIPEITERFDKFGSSFLEIRAIESDIVKYLEDEMKQSSTNLIKKDAVLQEDIKIGISKAADGMFLLARLYLELLQEKLSVKEIRDELQALRDGARVQSDDEEKTNTLTGVYDKMMERINKQSLGMRNFAIKILLWVTFTKRALTISELQHGLATKKGMKTLNDEHLPDLGDIGRVCVGLVIVDEKRGIIQLVHYTTQRYFEDMQPHLFPKADSVLLEACIAYLSFEDFERGLCQSDDEFEEQQTKFPLCNYASSHWGNHATENGEPGKELLGFLEDSAKVEASVQAQLAVKQYSSHAGYSQEVPRGVTALHLAAQFGLTELMRVLLKDKHKYRTNSRDSDDQTPLLWATRNGHEGVTRLLINAKAALEVRDREQGATPLIWAARNGYENLVRLLVENDGDVNAKDKSKRTPLSLAAFYKHESVIKFLLDKGGIIDANDATGMVKLLATRTESLERQEIVKILFELDSNPSAEARDDEAAVIPCTAENWSEVAIKKLLKNEDNLDEMDENGRRLLSRAAEGGDEEMVKRLMATGKVDINGRDGEHQETALIWAARKGHMTIVKLLLDAGADVNVKEQDLGETALTLAIESCHEATIHALLDKGANIHHRDHSDHTPLFAASWQGSESVMKLLLDRGADVSARNEDGQTPIFNTCAFGNAELVKMLLDRGADIDAVDVEGRTPLFFAAALGQRDVVSLLLERGITVNVRDKQGRTALFSAIGSGEKDVVNLLLDTNRLDIYQADENGTTPTEWANENGNRDIIQLLRRRMGGS